MLLQVPSSSNITQATPTAGMMQYMQQMQNQLNTQFQLNMQHQLNVQFQMQQQWNMLHMPR